MSGPHLIDDGYFECPCFLFMRFLRRPASTVVSITNVAIATITIFNSISYCVATISVQTQISKHSANCTWLGWSAILFYCLWPLIFYAKINQSDLLLSYNTWVNQILAISGQRPIVTTINRVLTELNEPDQLSCPLIAHKATKGSNDAG